MIAAAVATTACGAGPLDTGDLPIIDQNPELSLSCQLEPDILFAGGPGRDGIPALINPPLVRLGHPGLDYLKDYAAFATDNAGAGPARVVGFLVDDVPIAIPYNILWRHEIVNLDVGGRRLAITYCPLTGSGLVFDATAAGTTRLGVSGLIYRNNLVMFDIETGSLWPQMCGRAAQGPRDGTTLAQIPAIDMLWEAWIDRRPNTLVVSSETGYDTDYDRYPYLFYEFSDIVLFPTEKPIDPRRPLKERILGLPSETGGLAVPFGELAGFGPIAAVPTLIGSENVIILWDAAAQAAAAYYPRTLQGTAVTIEDDGLGFVDRETGSRWDIHGRAVSGPAIGAMLEPVEGSFMAYWFAWAAFHPETLIWGQE